MSPRNADHTSWLGSPARDSVLGDRPRRCRPTVHILTSSSACSSSDAHAERSTPSSLLTSAEHR